MFIERKSVIKKTALLLSFLFLTVPAFAEHPDTKTELENLKDRIQALEKQGNKGEDSKLSDHLTFSGVIEAEASYVDAEGADSESDLVLATAELSIEAALNDALGGHVILLYEEEEGEPDNVVVDEAVISLAFTNNIKGLDPALHVGKMYLPFGKFSSYMVSDPLTLELGETQDTAILLGFEGELLSFNLGVFNGETDPAGDENRIDSWVASLEITAVENVTIGASYISDLAESDSGLVQDTDPATLYTDDVAGFSGYLSAQVAQIALEFEYLAAADDFDAALLGLSDLSGQSPEAWNLELAWMPNENIQIAARYEEAEDFQDDMQRYGATVSYGLFDHAVVALEYLNSDADAVADDTTDTVTAQLALEF